MTWRKACRQCGAPTAPGRAWCRKHLRLVQLGKPTDIEHIPDYDQAKSIVAGSPDRPFPFWPTTTTLTNR